MSVHLEQRDRVVTNRPAVATLRVLVVCDQHLMSEAIRMAMRSRPFDLVGLGHPDRTVHPRLVSRVAQDLQPHVGLLVQDLRDPLTMGEPFRILREVTTVPWLLVTGTPEGALWGAGLEAGARAVLPMTIGLAQLADALERLAAGGEVMAPGRRERALASWLDRGEGLREVVQRLERLTPREMEVLRALGRGTAVQEIAEKSGVLVATVRSQVKSILRKLEVRSQLAAVAVLQQVTGHQSAA